MIIKIFSRLNNGRWLSVGEGELHGNQITNCAADIGDAVYHALRGAIAYREGAPVCGTYTVDDVDGQDWRIDVERQKFRIGLNASQDLYEAGFSNDETQVRAFEQAYHDAALEYVRGKDMEIEIVCGSGMELEGCDTSEQAGEIWQAIHDAVAWTGPRTGG